MLLICGYKQLAFTFVIFQQQLLASIIIISLNIVNINKQMAFIRRGIWDQSLTGFISMKKLGLW